MTCTVYRNFVKIKGYAPALNLRQTPRIQWTERDSSMITRLTMRYRMILLASLLAGTLAMTGVATAERRDLQRKRVEGVVESMNGQQAFIRTDQGARVGVRLGPESFWRERGYRLRSGSRVTVDGWWDPGESDWYFAGSIGGPGFYFELSNDDGIPYWVNDDDYYYGSGWGPCCETYDVWYGCHPYPDLYTPPPPPPRYYFYWGPRWRYYHPYRHYYDRGWHRGWDRGHHEGGWDRGHHEGGWNGRHDRDGHNPPPPPPRGGRRIRGR